MDDEVQRVAISAVLSRASMTRRLSICSAIDHPGIQLTDTPLVVVTDLSQIDAFWGHGFDC